MPLILPSRTLDSGYDISNSLVQYGTDQYLRRTFTAGSRTTFTISFWLKRGNISTSDMNIFDAYKDDNNRAFVYFVDNDLRIFGKSSATTYIDVLTDRKFRDPNAWYHFVVAFDTTQGTETNRIKVYVNGVQETSFSTYSVLHNYATFFNDNTRTQTIGTREDSGGEEGFYDGYISEVHYIDGAQKVATDFGETNDDGVWIPIKYTGGSYGTNGFFLEFKETGTGADSSSIGADTSGEGNHLQPVNHSALHTGPDTPTNNFSTLNSVNKFYSPVVTKGNLDYDSNSSSGSAMVSSIAPSTGKWYVEVKALTSTIAIGVSEVGLDSFRSKGQGASRPNINYAYGGSVTIDEGSADSEASFTTNDIIGLALNLDDGELIIYKNGTALNSGTAYNLHTNTTHGNTGFSVQTHTGSGNTKASFNFGNPKFTISSSNADANGYGSFEYAVPTGYYALNTKNLAEYG